MTWSLGRDTQSFFFNFNNGVLNFYAYWSKNPCDIIFFWKNWCLGIGKCDFVNAWNGLRGYARYGILIKLWGIQLSNMKRSHKVNNFLQIKKKSSSLAQFGTDLRYMPIYLIFMINQNVNTWVKLWVCSTVLVFYD